MVVSVGSRISVAVRLAFEFHQVRVAAASDVDQFGHLGRQQSIVQPHIGNNRRHGSFRLGRFDLLLVVIVQIDVTAGRSGFRVQCDTG